MLTLVDGLGRFSEQAHTIIASKWAREAFNTTLESRTFTKPFGDSAFGWSCPLASRLERIAP